VRAKEVRLKDWGMFSLLGLLWGSSFFWIKVGLRGTGPLMLVALRLTVGMLGLALVVALRKPKFPRTRTLWVRLIILGTFNTAFPFVIITWGQQSIETAMASILNGTVPLFTILLAHLFLEDEKITAPKFVGLLVGFGGVVLLLGGGLNSGKLNTLAGQAAVLVASISYASSIVFARRSLRETEPLVQAFIPLVAADILVWLATPVLENQPKVPVDGEAWFAILWLGLLGTFVAFILYFSLLQSVGPTKTSLVTYVVPVVGLILGVVFLDETLDLRLAMGTVLIIAGIVVVNWVPATSRANAKISSDT
jgi:drug/metabolite transporter (DMT)-like permease